MNESSTLQDAIQDGGREVLVVQHLPPLDNEVFSSLADSFAAVLAVKGALTPRPKSGALHRSGPLQTGLCSGGKARPGRLRTTIANSLDP